MPAHSLATLRRRVMARFGDLVEVTATEDDPTGLSLVDEDTLVGEPGRYAGREILFTSGANAGLTRYIKGSSRDNSAVDFSRALPSGVVAGDTALITNAYGIGVTFRAVKDAINYALDMSRDYALVPAEVELADAFDPETGVLDLPEEFVAVEGIHGIDEDGHLRHIERAMRQNGNGWSVSRANRQLMIRGYRGHLADGYRIVVRGYTLPATLEDDSDTTTVDLEWLVETATAHLALDTLLSRQATGDWGSKGMLYQQRADRIRSRLTPVLGPSFVRVD